MTVSVTTFLTTVVQFAKTDELKLIAPALGAFFTNVSANSSQLNIANQALVLLASLQATLPQLEADVVKEVNSLVQADIQAYLTSQTTTTAS